MKYYFLCFFCCIILLILAGGCGLAGHTENSALTEAADVSLFPKPPKVSGPAVKKKIDILFVVDSNPALMDTYLKNVKNSFKDFVSILSAAVEWKIAFTNADYDPDSMDYYHHNLFAGNFMPLELNGEATLDHVLYSHSKNRDPIFLNTLKRYELGDVKGKNVDPCQLPPYCQSHIRNPVQSLLQAITFNPGFFRYDAHAVAVIFTNGDEMSAVAEKKDDTENVEVVNEQIMEEKNTESIQDSLAVKLQKVFQKHYGSYRSIRVFSISVIPDDEDCLNQVATERNVPGVAYSTHIYEVVKHTGGRMVSICSPHYSALASAIVHTE